MVLYHKRNDYFLKYGDNAQDQTWNNVCRYVPKYYVSHPLVQATVLLSCFVAMMVQVCSLAGIIYYIEAEWPDSNSTNESSDLNYNYSYGLNFSNFSTTNMFTDDDFDTTVSSSIDENPIFSAFVWYVSIPVAFMFVLLQYQEALINTASAESHFHLEGSWSRFWTFFIYS